MKMRPPIIDSLVQALAAHPEVHRIILFGSRARGDNDERSDIDMAVEAPAASKPQWLEIVRLVEEAETLLSVQLVRIEEVSEGLRKRIESEGKVLYDRSKG